jgi:hypothetical protein
MTAGEICRHRVKFDSNANEDVICRDWDVTARTFCGPAWVGQFGSQPAHSVSSLLWPDGNRLRRVAVRLSREWDSYAEHANDTT